MDDTDMTIIGDPAQQADFWQLQVENDNCAVTAEMSLINQFGHDLSQEEAMYISSSHGWYQPGNGTSADYVGNLMQVFGIDVNRVENGTIEGLASELRQGHGVIVGVRSDQLWEGSSAQEFWNDIKSFCGLDNSQFSPADHAVVVTGIDTTDPSNPMVILNDSGDPNGQAHPYPLERFLDAWQNSDFTYTATTEPLPTTSDNLFDLPVWDFLAGLFTGSSSALAGQRDDASSPSSFFSDTNNIALL